MLRIGDAPVSGGTGLRLLSNHRALSENIAIAFGARRIELGGIAIVNDELLQMMNRLRFEKRLWHNSFFRETIAYRGRDFGIQQRGKHGP